MNQNQKDFEAYLKASHHFIDALHTHRVGVARVIAAIVTPLAKHNPELLTDIKKSLQDADIDTGSASINSEIRRITKEVRFQLFPDPSKPTP